MNGGGSTMAAGNGFKVVAKFRSSTLVDFVIVLPNGDSRIVGRIEYPLDGQLGESVDANKEIAQVLSKRIKKSMP